MTTNSTTSKQLIIIPTVIMGNPIDSYREQIKLLKESANKAKSINDLLNIKRQAIVLEELIFKLQKEYDIDNETLILAAETSLRLQRKFIKLLLQLKHQKSLNEEINVPSLKELGIGKNSFAQLKFLAQASSSNFVKVIAILKRDLKNGNLKAFSLSNIVRELRNLSIVSDEDSHSVSFSPLIKPSDNWNFSPVRFQRLDDGDKDGWGYIPGDIYANCLWFYAKPQGLVVAPMAGTGQIKKVYDDRESWMGTHKFDVNLKMFDLNPRGAYKKFIKKNDLTEILPILDVDYIVIDIPYYGMVNQQYSTKTKDIANLTNYEDWKEAIHKVAQNCYKSQKQGSLCTVITPNYRDVSTGKILMVTDDTREAWITSGYILYDKAYASRRIQQQQSIAIARMNNMAKSKRILLSDISEILTFKKL
jgi:hypothetical protein